MAWKAIVAAAFVIAGVSDAHAHDFGPSVGQVLPVISAMDQAGAQRNLVSLSGENGLVLLVTRAADWCPYCQRQMIDIESIRSEVERRGWRIATISTDSVEELARFAQRRNIGYAMLSDEQALVVRQLELLDPTQPPGRRHNGLPVPTLLFLSPQGEVRAKLGDEDYRIRPAPQLVLETLERLR